MVDVCDRLSIEKPVLQGAMGAVARYDLTAAVSNAGGLGTLSFLPPSYFAAEMKRLEADLDGKTFAANLLMPLIEKRHVEACLNSNVPIVTLFYGFDQAIVDALKARGKIVLFQIGSLAEARKVIAAGADGVIVQGFEAGGHVRGTTPLADLLPQVKEAFPDHMVAGAGGIYDRASAEACRALGADAVCAGTRFLASPEASAHTAYKARILEAEDTVYTNLFGMGWRDPHRVIPNAATRKWLGNDGKEPVWMPALHTVTNALAKLAPAKDGGAAMTARQSLGRPLYTPNSLMPEMDESLLELVALYAGAGVAHITEIWPAAKTVDELAP